MNERLSTDFYLNFPLAFIGCRLCIGCSSRICSHPLCWFLLRRLTFPCSLCSTSTWRRWLRRLHR